jgi:hypothetical protein
LAVYRRTADGSETLADGAVSASGERVSTAAGRPFGIIFSGRARHDHDAPAGRRRPRRAPLAREATTLSTRPTARRCAALGALLLRHRRPRFHGRAGRRRRRRAAERSAAGGLAALPRGLEQSIFTLEKEVRP